MFFQKKMQGLENFATIGVAINVTGFIENIPNHTLKFMR